MTTSMPKIADLPDECSGTGGRWRCCKEHRRETLREYQRERRATIPGLAELQAARAKAWRLRVKAEIAQGTRPMQACSECGVERPLGTRCGPCNTAYVSWYRKRTPEAEAQTKARWTAYGRAKRERERHARDPAEAR